MKKLAVAALIAAASCQVAEARGVDTNSLQFGEAPLDPVESAKSLMLTYLKDPASAEYRWNETYKGYCKGGWAKGGGVAWHGWAATILVNAKNSFGAFGGFEPYTILFNGESAVRIIEGAHFGAYGPSKGMLGLGGGAGVCQTVN